MPSYATFDLFILSVTGNYLTPRARKVNSLGCPISIRNLMHEWTREEEERRTPKTYRSSGWQGE